MADNLDRYGPVAGPMTEDLPGAAGYPEGRAWHLPVDAPVTGRQFLSLVGDAAGGTPRKAGLGRGMQRLIGMVNPVVRELGETWYQRDRAWVVDDSAFRAAFGAQRVTPHTDAVKTTVEWFRTNA